MNERDSVILGAGGLLLTDSEVCARALPKGTYVVLDTKNLEAHVLALLQDEEALRIIRKSGQNFAESHLSYDQWAEKIATTIMGITPKH